MPYTPPVGVADLSLAGSYTPPVGTADLAIGATLVPDRTATIAGTTAAPVGALSGLSGRIGNLAGTTAAPSGQISARRIVITQIVGTTSAPTGRLQSHYDPNLLSDVCQVFRQDWQEGLHTPSGIQVRVPAGDAASGLWSGSLAGRGVGRSRTGQPLDRG